MGDRKIPVFNEPLKDKTLIPIDATFDVDVENGIVRVIEGPQKIDLGKTVLYMVD